MAKDNNKVAFRTAFRGYKKSDVNSFIEMKAADYSRKEEEYVALLRQKDEKFADIEVENSNLSELLSASDSVIANQKATIDEQSALIEELKTAIAEKDIAFSSLYTEVEILSARITALAEEHKNTQDSQKEKRDFPRVRLEKKQEPKPAPIKNTDSDSISGALKAIKNKILSFLK